MAKKFLKPQPEHVSDLMLDVPRGLLPGMEPFNKFGRNSNVALGTTQEIWDGSAVYSWPTSALMTSISQTTDQVAMRGATIEVQGLDANWHLVVQDATLDASDTNTVVTLATPLIRVFRMLVKANVVGDSPIRVHNAEETQDYAIISTGNNQTEMAIFTVPVGFTCYITQYYAAMNPATNKNPVSNQIRLWVRDNLNGYESQMKHTIGMSLEASAKFDHPFRPYLRITEMDDIFITSSPSDKAADMSAGFDLISIRN